MLQQFHAQFEKDSEWWIASAVEIPGAFSQGKTLDEARENLMDAVRELLLARRDIAEAEASEKPEMVQEELAVQID
jgi:predicted RNase H-like HicB family nuclease